MASTKIQWATKVWNPVTGCDKISEGCANCYAEKFAKRLHKNPNKNISHKYRNGFKVTTHPEALSEPEKWKKPQRVFVCSMGDLFHEDVPFEFITRVFATMLMHPQHTFMLLTKRAQRMKDFIDWVNPTCLIDIKNIWFGVTAENQRQFNERVSILLSIKSNVHFVSIEPMLSEIKFDQLVYIKFKNWALNNETQYPLDWVIVGGETGHDARPLNPRWVKSIQEQCQTANIPFFFKQWGEWTTIDRTEVKKHPLNNLKTDLHDHLVYAKVGKKVAGHLIDGKEFKQFPVLKERGV